MDKFSIYTIEFYYYMNILDNGWDAYKNRTDDGEEPVCLPIDEIISEGKMIHVIEERDR